MKYYKKYYKIPAPPEEVYGALTNPLAIHQWTGAPVEMNTEPGSEFSLWDGAIIGRNLAFETDKKIVQEWFFGPQEEESIVTIVLHKDGKGTSLELRHTNIPDEAYDDISNGWDNHYMASLIEFY